MSVGSRQPISIGLYIVLGVVPELAAPTHLETCKKCKLSAPFPNL